MPRWALPEVSSIITTMFGINEKYTSKDSLTTTILSRDFGSTAVWIGFNRGSFAQPLDKIGLAHFAEHIILKESKNYQDTSAVNSKLMGLGVTWGAQTGLFNSIIKINVPDSEDTENVLDIFFDKIFQPSLLDQSIKNERDVIITELRSRKQNISNYSCLLLHNAILGLKNNDWSFNGGDEKVIKRITKNDLQNYISENFSTNNLRLIVAGKTNVSSIKRYLDKKTPPLSKSNPARQEWYLTGKPTHIKMKNPDSLNKLNILQEAYPIVVDSPQDAAKLLLLRNYLSGSRNSHILRILKAKLGLIYNTRSWTIYSSLNDFVCFSYEVNSENYERFTAEKNKIYHELANGKLSEKLFTETQNYLSKVINKWLEPSDSLCEYWLTYKVADKPFGFSEIAKAIKQIQFSDFTAFTSNIFQATKEDIATVEVL